MIKSATEKFVKHSLSENDCVETFYVKMDDGKDCSIVCSQTKNETTISFITCVPIDTAKFSLDVSSMCREIVVDRYRVEKNKEVLVFIYSRRYAPGIAYIHREKNITRALYDGLKTVAYQSNRLNLNKIKKGEKHE